MSYGTEPGQTKFNHRQRCATQEQQRQVESGSMMHAINTDAEVSTKQNKRGFP
jgi:hypothetical protein